MGSIYLGDPRPYLPPSLLPENSEQADIIGEVLVEGGTSLTLGGIVSRALIKTNRAEVHALRSISSKMVFRPLLLAPGITPTADRSGAVAGVALALAF